MMNGKYIRGKVSNGIRTLSRVYCTFIIKRIRRENHHRTQSESMCIGSVSARARAHTSKRPVIYPNNVLTRNSNSNNNNGREQHHHKYAVHRVQTVKADHLLNSNDRSDSFSFHGCVQQRPSPPYIIVSLSACVCAYFLPGGYFARGPMRAHRSIGKW